MAYSVGRFPASISPAVAIIAAGPCPCCFPSRPAAGVTLTACGTGSSVDQTMPRNKPMKHCRNRSALGRDRPHRRLIARAEKFVNETRCD